MLFNADFYIDYLRVANFGFEFDHYAVLSKYDDRALDATGLGTPRHIGRPTRHFYL